MIHETTGSPEMATEFGKAAEQALTNAAASQGRSTESSARYDHFLKCLRLWEAMMPKKAGDDVAGELLARGYFRMLGHLGEAEMSALTEMVLERCKWFPTVAECREIMAEQSYSNPFHRSRITADLVRNGYLEGPKAQQITDQSEGT
jgi:hypothetical protein